MPDLILVSEAAEVMGVSYRSAKRSLKNAVVPFYRIGHAPAVTQADFIVFLAARTKYSGRGRLPSIIVEVKSAAPIPERSEWAALRDKIEQLAAYSETSPYQFLTEILDERAKSRLDFVLTDKDTGRNPQPSDDRMQREDKEFETSEEQ